MTDRDEGPFDTLAQALRAARADFRRRRRGGVIFIATDPPRMQVVRPPKPS